jgi:UDP-glucuronate 4-epimerase
LEKILKKKVKKNYMPMQKGDVHSTLSDSTLLKRITGYNPKTNYKEGIKKFVDWYLNYHC